MHIFLCISCHATIINFDLLWATSTEKQIQIWVGYVCSVVQAQEVL